MKTKDYNAVDWNEVFYEDSSSPSGLRWRIRSSRRAKAGNIAGSILNAKKSSHQCFQVRFNKITWLVHRILWVMRNGSINPDLEIDHIDGDSLNNSAENLRLVSTIINQRNQKQPITNSSGVTGVNYWRKEKGTVYTHVVARWNNLNGEQESKYFSCDLLGKELAFQQACEYREKMINELNNNGAGYSDRHGK